MTRRVFILGGAGLVFTHVILGDLGVARSDSAVDRLSLPESIEFNGESYRLSWSSHPKPDYYKQEYLPSGLADNPAHRRMSAFEGKARLPRTCRSC
ncbi:MAG: hypothetical protein WBY84_07560, partial [Pseudolabrys sp.]